VWGNGSDMLRLFARVSVVKGKARYGEVGLKDGDDGGKVKCSKCITILAGRVKGRGRDIVKKRGKKSYCD